MRAKLAVAAAVLSAGLATGAQAQSVVPWVGLSEGNGGSQCSGPLSGMTFPSLAAAEAYTGGLRCQGGAAQNFCGPVEHFAGDWVVRQVGAYWRYRMTYGWSLKSDCTSIDATMSYTVERPIAQCPNWEDCEPPDPCSEQAGRKFDRTYNDTETRGAVCVTVDWAQCRAEPVGVHACLGGLCAGSVNLTGAHCGDEPEPEEDEKLEPDPATENCISTGSLSLCYRSDEKNCGWVNGERWCAPEPMREGCISTASGGMVCVGDVGPVDETGELLAADGEFVTGVGGGAGSGPGQDRQWRYYGRDTVATGSGAVRTSRPSEGDVGEGGGDGGDGEYPDLDDGESWGEATEGFWAQVQDTPWGQALAVSGIPDGGECPTATFDFFGQELTISWHCDLIEEYSGLLGIVFLFGWSLLGVRIILSA